ncbi:amidohydrolase family protein [Polymorphum gilvum]|uniref:Amidohydrolase:Amidohydrolase-like protein n=1 Tax=Polymorphum gilvum (strain LMG 25793 / CGMCC 1.9160 / SL003B-26A1) TaxID=991905 RepID=F2J2G6_POLGS|nr:amidohydrolase family protein [Polymorphum gilvum]ADZ70881.1 Amidohydrolase:Amidohydrolase-like protein [Polymorphum gilvum SL003B-26A1]
MSTTLIRDAIVVTMDERIGDLQRGSVLIENDRIAAVAPDIAAPEGAEVIEGAGMLAMPGFVNAHIHTWQTALRGIAADWTIAQYLRAMHAGLAGHFRPDDIRVANYFGALNQIASGTTTIADWCHNNPTPDHTDAAIDGLTDAGIRAVFLHGSPKPDPKPGQKHFSQVPMPAGEVHRLRGGRLASDDALVTLGLAILGPQLSVWDVCDADFRLARDLDLTASMHVSGKLLTEDGFERLAALGLLGPRINVVHGNVLDDDRLKLLVDHDVSFTLTPEVELQMGFGDPLTTRLRKIGGRLSLGSDIESSMAGDMFAVTRVALQAARHADNLVSLHDRGSCPDSITVPSREALRWSTIEGARMLGLDDRIGSLSPGKQADIVLLDSRKLNMHPVVDPAASILFHAGVVNVDTVLIAGRPRKRGGELVDAPQPAELAALARSGRRILDDFAKAQS